MDISTVMNNSVDKKIKVKRNTQAKHGPQQCQVCAKVFGNASALAKHKLTHSNERKYICTTCTKAFKRQDHLNGHLLTHRNKKPFECDQPGCGKSYCDARSLRRHVENHHKCGVNLGTAKTIVSSNNTSGNHFDNVQIKNLEIRPRTWNIQMKLQNTTCYDTSRSEIVQITENSGQKLLVECHLCHRNFKNIPALNGHMRLHGGYLKKDLDKIKVKKEKVPHLITASVGVRALIGEKIYNKRNIDQILVTPTNFKRQTVFPEREIPVEGSNEDNPANVLVDSKINGQQVLIPVHLHRQKLFAEKVDPVLVKTQNDNLNPKLNKNIRQIVYSLDPSNASADIDELRKLFNMQVIQKDLIGLDKKDAPRFTIDDLTPFKTLQAFGNDITIKTNEFNPRYLLNSNRVDQSYLIYGTENENNNKNHTMVKADDPLLSATSKEPNSRRISLISLKSDFEKGCALNIKKPEIQKHPSHYRPYSILAKTTETNTKQYSKAKINIGINYQANIPELLAKKFTEFEVDKLQTCIWNPECLADNRLLENYCSLLKSRIFNNPVQNEEVGLKMLNEANGEVHLAISNCFNGKTKIKNEDRWTKHEFEYFFYFLKNKGKKFDIMSKNIGTKSTFECVQMYYLVKKSLLKK